MSITTKIFKSNAKDRLIQHYGYTKEYQIVRLEKRMDAYAKALLNLMQKWRRTINDEDPRQISIPLKELRKVGKEGPARNYFYKTVETVCPVYMVNGKGSNLTKEVTRITMSRTIHEYLDEADIKEYVLNTFGDLDIEDPEVCHYTPIDCRSLRSYIQWAESLPEHERHESMPYKIGEAKRILAIASYIGDDKNGNLPQVIKKSPFGRTYYLHENLQTVSKDVRHAALGDHYEYDLNSAVYAIKYYIMSQMLLEADPTITQADINRAFPNTMDYISEGGKYKEALRKRLAITAFDIDPHHDDPNLRKVQDYHLKKIKQAITYVGFGARVNKVTGYKNEDDKWVIPSIAQIFGFKGYNGDYILGNLGKERYARLISDEWFGGFAEEQKTMTKAIVSYYIDNELVTKDQDYLLDRAGKFSQAKVMSYVFQTLETEIMDMVCSMIPKENLLLRVHDAIFTRRPIDLMNIMFEVNEKYKLDGITAFKLGQTQRERYLPQVDKQAEYEHKVIISQQELLAKGYKSVHISVDNMFPI